MVMRLQKVRATEHGPQRAAGEEDKTADPDFLREMIGFTAQRLMEVEVETRTGAALGAHDPERLTHRNGYRAGEWETRAGTVHLQIPRVPLSRRSRVGLCVPGSVSFVQACLWLSP
jgi:hypothetical protein